MEKEITLQYSNDDLTVFWKPNKCIHSTLCWKQLKEVFRPTQRPWVNMQGADSDAIKAQVDKCPSQALSYEEKKEKVQREEKTNVPVIEVIDKGPLIFYGDVVVRMNGEEKKNEKQTAFCRCGRSGNKPFCDGSHNKDLDKISG
jgi:uncharacterized Fe-S cluster protein YjdI